MVKRKSHRARPHRKHSHASHSRSKHSVVAPMTIAPMSSPPMAKANHEGFIKMLSVLVVFALIGGIVYKYLMDKAKGKNTGAAATTASPVVTPAGNKEEGGSPWAKFVNAMKKTWVQGLSGGALGGIGLLIIWLVWRSRRGASKGMLGDLETSTPPSVERKMKGFFRRIGKATGKMISRGKQSAAVEIENLETDVENAGKLVKDGLEARKSSLDGAEDAPLNRDGKRLSI